LGEKCVLASETNHLPGSCVVRVSFFSINGQNIKNSDYPAINYCLFFRRICSGRTTVRSSCGFYTGTCITLRKIMAFLFWKTESRVNPEQVHFVRMKKKD
jgi:hypothetical protein